MEYNFNTNYLDIITESASTTSPVYREAANDVDKNTNKGVAYLKNFMSSIENLAEKSQVKDERIASSKGNIKDFKGYSDIKSAITFLNKNLSGLADVKNCVTVFDALENWSSLYEDGYKNNIRLIQLEYENAVFMLSTSLSSIIATNMDVVANGTEIRITKKQASTHGVIQKTMADLAKQLGTRDHKDYLEGLIKANGEVMNESTYTESVVGAVAETLKLVSEIWKNAKSIFKSGANIFNTIKRSLFGIIPLIRSIMYLRYKKKADTVISLEEQIIFIERNIDQLKNIKTMDEAKKKVIIKKQQAVIEQYKKKAEKLRAELMETEKQATEAIKKEDPQMKETEGELVLESVAFMEAGKLTKKQKNFMRANRDLPKKEIKDLRFDKYMDKFTGSPKKFTPSTEIKKTDVEEKAKKAFELFCKNTEKESIRLMPMQKHEKEVGKNYTTTKIGGIPYWPKDMEWPSFGKTPMVCLAQLNMDKLPHLAGYPTTGILQFFIVDTESYGSTKFSKVVYHKDTKAEHLEEVPRSTLNDTYDEYNPVQGVYYPKVSLQKQPMTWADDNFDAEFIKAINAVFGTEYKGYFDVPDNIRKAFGDASKYDDDDGCRFGGHPYFTQSDVRDDHYSELLLQLDSESGMMWGDCGVANFFISKEDLAKKDFDDVYFTWDCM